MNKKNIIYIVMLCVCFALDVVALALSFCLNRFYGVLSSSKCTQYEAVIAAVDSSDADMVSLSIVEAKIWDSKSEEEKEEAQAGEEPVKVVSCTLHIMRHDMIAEEESRLVAGADITFLVEEGELTEGGEGTAVALRVRISQNSEEDIDIATLALHDREKLEKAKHTQIGLLCGVLVFLAVGGVCMYKLSSKKARW